MSIPDDPFAPTPPSPPQRPVITTSLPPSRNVSPSDSGPSVSTTPGALQAPPNTQGASGTKTPRRVQFPESHIVQVHDYPRMTDSPSGTLDESNIDQLQEQLRRVRDNSRLRRPPSMLSQVSSGDVTDGEDYDYRLDVDPPPAPLEPVTSAGSNALQEGQGLHALLDHGRNELVTGEYIPIGETDGLPSMPAPGDNNGERTEAETAAEAAADLVRQHTGKWGVLRRRVKAHSHAKALATPGARATTSGTEPDPEKAEQGMSGDRERNGFDASFARDRPAHRRADSTYSTASSFDDEPLAMPNLPGGASVLSSLLALYGQQHRPGMESTRTSLASSAVSSEMSDSDDEDTRRRKEIEQIHGVQIHDHPRRPSNVSPHDPNHPDRPSPLRSSSTGSIDRQVVEPGFLKAIKRAKEHWRDRERPKAARSSAGVFGALVQNTAHLSGAATPAGATLAPASRRTGWQLDRYDLGQQEDHEELQRPWRPANERSRPGSRAGSRPSSRPASIHSSTIVGDSPQDIKPSASDDMLSTRSKDRKRPGKIDLTTVAKMPVSALKAGGHGLQTAEKWIMSGGKYTPEEKDGYNFFTPRPLTEEDIRRKEREKERKKRKKAREARKKQEIFIIQHVAAYIQRQQFILKLARALMMFGSPSHRLETQIQATAKVLEINAQVVYLPGLMLVSFGDDATHTSETKFLKQATGLDLGKLLATHHLYWNVVHDRMSVEQASKDLDVLMTTPVYYAWWQVLIIGALCSAFICVIAFYGSFIDALIAMPLGVTLCGVQILVARNDMLSNIFEIAIACIISFVAAALASTGYFCYTAVVSGGVVLILPGYIVLTGALELASRNITAGAVRIGYSVIYSLFLAFGITIGAEIYRKITGLNVVGADDYTCATTHDSAHWWLMTPSAYWYFLCCPGYSLFLSLRNQQPLFAKELPVMVLISVAGWVSNHFSGLAFVNRSDIVSAIGSFVVGTLGNIYGRFTHGSSFPVTVTGILFQLPSGLGNGGIFSFAAQTDSTEAWSDAFNVAQQLVSVAIGLTVGLFVSAIVTHPFGLSRRSGSGIFAF